MTTESQNRNYAAMAAGMARAVVAATEAAPLAPVHTAAVAPKAGHVYCAVCNEWHALSPKGHAMKMHRVRAMNAAPMALDFWAMVRTMHEVK